MYENLFPHKGIAQVPFLYDKEHNALLNEIISQKGIMMNEQTNEVAPNSENLESQANKPKEQRKEDKKEESKESN